MAGDGPISGWEYANCEGRATRNRARHRGLPVLGLVIIGLTSLSPSRADEGWGFTDNSTAAGMTSAHRLRFSPIYTPVEKVAGGAAVGDYDGDGDLDIYVELGDADANALFRNRGDGTFEDVAAEAGVALPGHSGSGALFVDVDGDGRLDLIVPGIEHSSTHLFRNVGGGRFEDISELLPFDVDPMVSVSAGDFDGDGDLDLFFGRWGSRAGACHLFENRGSLGFRCADKASGLEELSRAPPWTFAGVFARVDEDDAPDLLVSADYGTSSIWWGDLGGGFRRADVALDDENGMGSAVGDFDGDGDLDWFVTSIWDGDGVTEGNWGTSGNRLYRNDGSRGWSDATDEARVRNGDWGWGAAFCDLDLDGHLDLVHVNGWPRGSAQFRDTPARLFVGSSFGRFVERGRSLGFDERGDGRGVICFDADRDGDLDLLISNFEGPIRLWRSQGRETRSSLFVHLEDEGPNPFGVGASVYLFTEDATTRREISASTGYGGHPPAEAHFGKVPENARVRVRWPDGETTEVDVQAEDRALHLNRQGRVQSAPGCSSLPI